MAALDLIRAMNHSSEYPLGAAPGHVRLFTLSAAPILGLTGAAKVWSAFGSSRLLLVHDPVLGVGFGHLMLGVGLIEVALAAFCLLGRRPWRAAMLVTSLASSFAGYRVSLFLIGWRKPCSCLGSLADALHVPPRLADTVMVGVLAYLLLAGYTVLLLGKQRSTLRSSEARTADHAPGDNGAAAQPQ
jgi:hypothetical protein